MQILAISYATEYDRNDDGNDDDEKERIRRGTAR